LFFLPKNQKPSFGAKEAKLWGWLHCAGLKKSQMLVAAELPLVGPFLFESINQKRTSPRELFQPLPFFISDSSRYPQTPKTQGRPMFRVRTMYIGRLYV